MSRKKITFDDGVLKHGDGQPTVLPTGERAGRTSYTGGVADRIFAGPACCRIVGVCCARVSCGSSWGAAAWVVLGGGLLAA